MIENLLSLASRAYFALCLASGRTLRAARYSTVRIVHQDSQQVVLKRRRGYAPILIWMSALPVGILSAGVRVLRQRDWERREREIYERLYGASVCVDIDGTLVLPLLPGVTLASLLEDSELEKSTRKRAIEHAAIALADFHRQGFTHGDAMAENVLVDLGAGVGHWFDFETVHDASRPPMWRRADDVRALLVTCLVTTAPEERVETLELILNAYADEEIPHVLAMSFTSVWRRSLTFHLLQAPLSFRCFRELGRLLAGKRRTSTG